MSKLTIYGKHGTADIREKFIESYSRNWGGSDHHPEDQTTDANHAEEHLITFRDGYESRQSEITGLQEENDRLNQIVNGIDEFKAMSNEAAERDAAKIAAIQEENERNLAAFRKHSSLLIKIINQLPDEDAEKARGEFISGGYSPVHAADEWRELKEENERLKASVAGLCGALETLLNDLDDEQIKTTVAESEDAHCYLETGYAYTQLTKARLWWLTDDLQEKSDE